MSEAMLKKLPSNVKKTWESVFKANKAKHGISKASEIAWSAVKKKYKKGKSGNWVSKKVSVKVKSTVGKSGIFKPQIYFDGILSNTYVDRDDDRMSPNLLNKFASQNLKGLQGDARHANLRQEMINKGYKGIVPPTHNELDTKGLLFLINSKYENNKLFTRVGVNAKHSSFKDYIQGIKDKEYKLSIELDNVKRDNEGTIIDAKMVGFSIDKDTRNYGTPIFNVSM